METTKSQEPEKTFVPPSTEGVSKQIDDTPARFRPPRSALWVDRFMTQFIKVGGLSIIVAVFGIFVFILFQILPLFRSAEVQETKSIPVPASKYVAMAVDEWGELPLLVTDTGGFLFVDVASGSSQMVAPAFPETKQITAVHADSQRHQVVVGTADGFFSIVSINYGTSFEGGKRKVSQALKAEPFHALGEAGSPIVQIHYADGGGTKAVAAIQDIAGVKRVYAATFSQTSSLMGPGEILMSPPQELTSQLPGEPVKVLVNMAASDIVVGVSTGDVCYFTVSGDQIQLRQTFRPFQDLSPSLIASMDYLFGGVSLVLTHPSGVNRVFSLYEKQGTDNRQFGQTKELPKLSGGAAFYDYSIRNKSFLVGHGKQVSLRFATTEDIRWEQQLQYDVSLGIIGGKYNSLYLLDTLGKLHIFSLKDPHPESSWKALFGKIWYEGAPGPAYSWQSAGATDDFEPKLSLVPLIIGTMKGTLYAMVFALPIAILAAIYTSQFMHPSFRILVKPAMEIMASLPSVVLGFLAALWLAPLLERQVPAIILMFLLVPLLAYGFGYFWSSLPVQTRVLIKPGYEWIVFLPLLLLGVWLSISLGPSFESVFFVATDPDTGTRVADFRLWWPQVTGMQFEQRNSLVVGFMMGFAVIPIIFTISEDAMSNVPPALRSGSLALGASRWQTAVRIVLPTASAGIFSAVMIGLGRAVGETMIVVMATGNTPIMDFNIFSGMRTLSANIAVELPEAPVHGTLYRSLFLGALALFLMTFTVNTLAEIFRQRLRDKYKTV